MQLILRVQSPNEQRSVAFRVGQVVQIGRTEWANLCLPGDPSLADVHCQIRVSADGCQLQNLAADAQTMVNGEPIEEVQLAHDDLIAAGGSQFRVELKGDWPVNRVSESQSETAEEVVLGPAAEVCARCELDLAELDLDAAATYAQFVTAALEAERYADMPLFLATALTKQEAVWWLVHCVDQVGGAGSPADTAALEAARAWVHDGSEENRRLAEQAMGAAETPAQQAAMAVFWSGGSIAPAGDGDIPADEGMTNRIIRGAILQLSCADEAKDPAELLRAFGDAGVAIATGEQRWDAS